jgi:hypothetical protein
MCPISSIAPEEFVRMPGGNDGERKSFPPIQTIKTINMQPRDAGVRKIWITGSITGPPIRTIGEETVKCKKNETTSAAGAIGNQMR